MRTHRRAALAAAIALALSTPSVMAGEWVRDSAGNMLVPPTPAVSQKLFNPIEEAKNPACPKKEEVIKHYILSESDLKSGNVKLLVGGLPQAFCRRLADAAPHEADRGFRRGRATARSLQPRRRSRPRRHRVRRRRLCIQPDGHAGGRLGRDAQGSRRCRRLIGRPAGLEPDQGRPRRSPPTRPVMPMPAHNAPDCPKCGSRPRPVGVTPRFGPYPELLTLRCTDCGEVFTTPADSDGAPLSDTTAARDCRMSSDEPTTALAPIMRHDSAMPRRIPARRRSPIDTCAGYFPIGGGPSRRG